MRDVSIVIPILNEGDNIKKLTRLLIKNLKKLKNRHEMESFIL